MDTPAGASPGSLEHTPSPAADGSLAIPGTSQCGVRLKTSDYDLSQLSKAFKAARTKPLSQPEPIPETFLHVHTLTVPASLTPPEAVIEYPDGERANPSREVYDDLVSDLMNATEAGMPLPLSLPSAGCVHLPFDLLNLPKGKRASTHQRSPDVFLPSSKNNRPLVKLPAVHLYAGRMHGNSTAWDMLHWLHAALALDPAELPTRKGEYRGGNAPISLRTGVQIVWFPPDDDGDDVDVQLVVTFDAYFDMEHLFDPLPEVGASLLAIVLVTVLPSGVKPWARDSAESWLAARAQALKEFYDCLRPAPEHPITFDAATLQPPELMCDLLPFQTRTVRHLLEREGAPLVDKAPSRRPTGQWTRFKFGKFGDYAFHRLNADLRPLADGKGKEKADPSDDDDTDSDFDQLPAIFDLANVRGTMLCEEMGKTVEAIALMILHRHPLSVARPVDRLAPPRISPEVDLQHPPEDYASPTIKEWLDAEHAAFAQASAWDEESQLTVSEVAATLVVTPLSLLSQWVAEMGKHAPHLRVCVYPGWKVLIGQIEAKRKAAMRTRKKREAEKLKRKSKRSRNQTRAKYARGVDGRAIPVEMENESSESEAEDDEAEASLLDLTQRRWLDYVRGHDVVITTYQTLSDDLAVANPAPARSRRATAKYNLGERPRSPLVMCEWFRVIMDEVQQYSDQSHASMMVSRIPRKFSLAMSGTPARSDIKDLMGSLRFLRVPVDRTMWYRLMQYHNKPAFHGLFRAIGVRTTKAEVNHEFDLPRQERFVIPVQLSDIEMHYYLDTLERQRERLLGQQGGFTPHLFRVALLHLRQICTHIQVGALQQRVGHVQDRGHRMHLGNHLMTMEDALKRMCDDHETETVAETRMLMRYLTKKGQYHIMLDEDDMRQVRAIGQYEDVREMGAELVKTLRARLAVVMGDREDSVDDDDEDKTKQLSQQEREHVREIAAIRSSIRETLLLIHHAWFLEGDARHQMNQEEKEVQAYEAAEAIRKEILQRPLKISNNSIESLQRAFERHSAYKSPDELLSTKTNRRGGLQTTDAIGQANSLLKILNDNALLVHRWREKLHELLTLPVDAGEDEQVPAPGQGQNVENPEDEYYAKALKAQGEIEAYLTAYAAAIADRKEMLLEDRTLLATHEGRIAKKRATKNSKETAEDVQNIDLDVVDDLTLKLMLERQEFRDRRKHEACERPIKAVLVELNGIEHSAMRQEEAAIASEAAAYLRAYVKTQNDIVTKLHKELDTIRATFNRRAIYFAALQDISDSVASEDSAMFRQTYHNVDKYILDSRVRLESMKVRSRYLQYLGRSGQRDLHEECVICFGTSSDQYAMLLACGHAFCVSCFREYRKAPHIGRRCATCKARIRENGMTRVRIKAKVDTEDKAETAEIEEEVYENDEDAKEVFERNSREDALAKINYLPTDRQRNFHAMDTMGEFGSKIDALIKHLKWYRLMHPDERHVVFSNWGDSLRIVEQALRTNRISYVSLDSNSKRNDIVEKFQNDPSITVFLLHAERESAGLTLTSCGVVHLLEPVLEHSFELQAIGRVDRLGQKRATTVYCYATLDTVESRILAQGVRNGTSIYLADKDEDEAARAALTTVAHAASHGGDVATVASTNDDNMRRLIF